MCPMGLVYLTRKEGFNAAHKLHRPEWSDEENLRVFGKCSNPNWHGHNYTLFVTVKGTPDPETGYVINLKTLSQLIRTEVINDLDHKNLNLDVDWMKGHMPSTEILAMRIWERLKNGVREMGAELHSVKIFETENNSAEYFG